MRRHRPTPAPAVQAPARARCGCQCRSENENGGGGTMECGEGMKKEQGGMGGGCRRGWGGGSLSLLMCCTGCRGHGIRAARCQLECRHRHGRERRFKTPAEVSIKLQDGGSKAGGRGGARQGPLPAHDTASCISPISIAKQNGETVSQFTPLLPSPGRCYTLMMRESSSNTMHTTSILIKHTETL